MPSRLLSRQKVGQFDWFASNRHAHLELALAQTFAGISVLAYAVYTGYSLPLPSMIGALKWISYLNVRLNNVLNMSCPDSL